MGWFTAIVLYVLIWWVTLFAVLPFWTAPVVEPDRVSGWRGAPSHPRLGRKLLVTSLVALLIWVACVVVISGPWLSFRHGMLALPAD